MVTLEKKKSSNVLNRNNKIVVLDRSIATKVQLPVRTGCSLKNERLFLHNVVKVPYTYNLM